MLHLGFARARLVAGPPRRLPVGRRLTSSLEASSSFLRSRGGGVRSAAHGRALGSSLGGVGSLGRVRSLVLGMGPGERPDEAGQLAGDRDDRLLAALAARQLPIPTMQPVLGAPGDADPRLRLDGLAPPEGAGPL